MMHLTMVMNMSVDHSKVGKFSRMKGRRNEQQLVLYLARHGYQAERILRQYQAAGQPDVKALKAGVTTTFEMKARKDSFKTIYALYNSEKDDKGVVAFVTHSGGKPVAMSTDLEVLLGSDKTFRNLVLFPPPPRMLKVYNRILKLDELRQTADYLCIKDNGKPMLFLRYW
jgi:Holliday junction resolvase